MATPNYFESSTAKEYGGDERNYAKQLHFHSGSEHTIDGKRFDLEMHIVHQSAETPPKDVATKHPIGKLAVVGIIFDQKKHDKVSD